MSPSFVQSGLDAARRGPQTAMSPWHTIMVVALVLLTNHQAEAFDRDVCIQSALWMLGNDTLSPNSSYFYRDTPNSPPYIDESNMTLTLSGCNAICGKQTWYADVGPRIEAWVLPIVLLLINIEVSPFGKRTLLELLHVIGDPIDSLWSLLHKIDAWERSYAMATQYRALCPSCVQIVATVFAGYEETQGPRLILGQADFEALAAQYKMVECFREWRRAAVRMADSRTDELIRTALAFILYLYQLIDNWVPSVGGEPSSPAGSRVCIDVLLSCFIPHILLTNAVGSVASRRSAHFVMHDLAVEVKVGAGAGGLPVEDRQSVFLPQLPRMTRRSTSTYYEALAWSGGVYVFRPWKLRYISSSRGSWLQTSFIVLLATLPVLIGMLGGSLLLWWQTPRGFNCRHIWLLGVSGAWILSATFTTMTFSLGLATGKYHWRMVLVKDAFVAVPTLILVFLEEAGLYNSCWCWSGPWEYPHGGRVMLPIDFFVSDGTIMYPMDLSAALLLQIVIVLTIMWCWRRGLRLLRWSEEMRQDMFELMLNGVQRCNCVANIQC